ncbi:MAG TPA: hypothetical protein VF753_08005 [Terriglobales bacterium]
MNSFRHSDKSRLLCFLFIVLLAPATLFATCKGDCQQGAMAGPFSASQVAENTTTGFFPVCSSCAKGGWSNHQLEGIDAQQNINTNYQFYDQASNTDSNIAVGPNVTGKNAQVLQWVDNQYVQAFDKNTGAAVFTNRNGTTGVPQSVDGLWSGSTQPECQGTTGNVQVIFDRIDGSYIINRRTSYNVGAITHYAWCIAASSGSDLSNPSMQWFAYEYKLDNIIPCVPSSNNCTTGDNYYYFPDWPRIGTWSNGFFITFDLTDPTENYAELGFEACQLDRADIVLGNPTNPINCYTYMVPNTQRPSLIHSVDVADIDSAKEPPAGEPEYFLAMVNPSNAQQSGNGEGVCTSKTTPCTSNQLALFSWGSSGLVGPSFVVVHPYTPGCYDTSGAGSEVNTICIPEPSTNTGDVKPYGQESCEYFNTPCVDSLGDRLANRLTYNNISNAGGPYGTFLTASHVIMESSSNQRTGIRYYILKVSSGVASVLVQSGGTSGPPDLQDPNGLLFYFMPSAALDKHGNLGITYTTSGEFCSGCSKQPHPAINFDVLPWKATQLAPATLIIQGLADEENDQHWGEYAATVMDSTNELTFYGVGQYFNINQNGTTSCGTPSSNCFTWKNRIFRGEYGTVFGVK